MQLQMHPVQIKKRVSWQDLEPTLQNNICRMQTVKQAPNRAVAAPKAVVPIIEGISN